jgi:hypothetical protein
MYLSPKWDIFCKQRLALQLSYGLATRQPIRAFDRIFGFDLGHFGNMVTDRSQDIAQM